MVGDGQHHLQVRLAALAAHHFGGADVEAGGGEDYAGPEPTEDSYDPPDDTTDDGATETSGAESTGGDTTSADSTGSDSSDGGDSSSGDTTGATSGSESTGAQDTDVGTGATEG